MIDAKTIIETLSRSVIATQSDDALRVTTHCLYPSNSSVSVLIRGGGRELIVSDDGGAMNELAGVGFRDRVTDRQIRALVKQQGLKVENGAIYSPSVAIDEAGAAILLVANASKEIADWALGHLRFSIARDFKRDLALLLERHFHDSLKSQQILGKSNKSHTFSNVVFLPGDRRLLIDPAVNDASSINARVVANLDVKLANDPTIQQLIVYDDQLSWAASDLALLQVGAPIVPFSLAEPAIMKRAA